MELAEGVAGPACGLQLGDAGADVIKIEPLAGDRARGWGPPQVGDTSAVFLALNRNKRSVALDLASASGIATAQRLLAAADVVIAEPARLPDPALDCETVAALNPQAVYCAISGFGPKGPWAGLPAGELPAQLLSEATASLGRPGEPPVRAGADLGSMYAAIYGVQGICAALLARDAIGRGQRVDVSLFGSLLAMRSTLWGAHSNPDEWWGFHLDSYVKPPDHGYQCRDLPIYFTLARMDADRNGLLRDLDMEWVRDDPLFDRFITDNGGGGDRYSHVVRHLWERGFAKFTATEVMAIIEHNGGITFPMNDYPRFVEQPQVQLLGVIRTVDHPGIGPVRMVAPPWTFSGTPAEIRRPAPRLGEHTEEVLREWRQEPQGAARAPQP